MEKKKRKAILKKTNKVLGFILAVGLAVGTSTILTGCFVKDTGTPKPPVTNPVDQDKENDSKPVELEDLANFEEEVKEFFGGEVVGHELEENKFSCYINKDGKIQLFVIDVSDEAGNQTKGELKRLTEEILQANPTALCTFNDSEKSFEYDGMKYNKNGIKGYNVFAHKIGESVSNSVTVLGEMIKKEIGTGFVSKLNVSVVTGIKTVVAELSFKHTDNLSEEEIYAGLLGEEGNVEKQEIPIGLVASQLKASQPEVIEEEVIDPAPTQEDIQAFKDLLASQVGDVVKYEKVDGILVVCSEVTESLNFSFYQLKEGEGFEKKSQLEKLSNSIKNGGLKTKISLLKNNPNQFEYDGYKYGYNIKGANPFDLTASSDTITGMQKFGIDQNSLGNFEAKSVRVVGDSDSTSIVFTTAPCDENASQEEQITALTGTSAVQTTLYLMSGNQLTLLTSTEREKIEEEIVERPSTQEEIEEFRQFLDSKVSGTLLDWEFIEDENYKYLQTYEKTANGLIVSSITLEKDKGIDTNFKMQALTEIINNESLSKYVEVKSSEETYEYDGYTYYINSLGPNPLFPNASSDFESSLCTLGYTPNDESSTGYYAVAKFIAEENGELKLYEFKAESPSTQSIKILLDNLKGAQPTTKTVTNKVSFEDAGIVFRAREVVLDQSQPTAEQIAEFESVLETKIDGTMRGYKIGEDKMLQVWGETNDKLKTYYYMLQENEGIDMVYKLENLVEAMKTGADFSLTMGREFLKESTTTYSFASDNIKYTYNANTIGQDLFGFAETDQTKTHTIIELVNENGKFTAVAGVLIGEGNQTKFGSVYADSHENASIDEMIEALKSASATRGPVETIFENVNALENFVCKSVQTEDILDQSQPTAEQIAEFESVLETKIDGTMLGYKIENGKLELWENEADRVACYQYVLGENEGLDMVYKLENLKQNVTPEKGYQIPKTSSVKYSYTLDNIKYIYSANTIGEDLFGLFTDNNSKSYTDIQFNPTNAVAKVYVENGNDTKLYEIRADYQQGTSQEDAIKALLVAKETLVSESVLPGVNVLANLNCERVQTEIIQTPTDPEETLDFSALEAKLIECIDGKSAFKVNDGGIRISSDGNNLYVLADLTYRVVNRISLYTFQLDKEIASQDEINVLVEGLTPSSLGEEQILITKSSSKISVTVTEKDKDGNDVKKTYTSENGTFVGNNPFARQCGIENAVKTYVSNISKPRLDTLSKTHYSAGYTTLVFYEENGETSIRLQPISIECIADATQEEILELSFSGKSYIGGELVLSEPINLGENMKKDENLATTNTQQENQELIEIDGEVMNATQMSNKMFDEGLIWFYDKEGKTINSKGIEL